MHFSSEGEDGDLVAGMHSEDVQSLSDFPVYVFLLGKNGGHIGSHGFRDAGRHCQHSGNQSERDTPGIIQWRAQKTGKGGDPEKKNKGRYKSKLHMHDGIG